MKVLVRAPTNPTETSSPFIGMDMDPRLSLWNFPPYVAMVALGVLLPALWTRRLSTGWYPVAWGAAGWVISVALKVAFALAMNGRVNEVKARRRPTEQLDPELPGPNLERELHARDEARRVAHAMARLPAAQRTVLSLFALEGLAQTEIADILGVPDGTVWSRLNVARRTLAEELGRRAR
jgi:RNA polymerase sigma factor (sigma-70 family)